jgi:IS30 family transposase
MSKPTKILAPPWIERNVVNGKDTITLETDAGIMTLGAAADATGIPHSTLYNRVSCTPNAWKEDDIFEPKRKRRERDGAYQAAPPPTQKIVDRPGKPFSAPKIGTWERRHYAADRFRREQTVKALPGMDQDYNSQLRLNRMMAR